MKLLWVRHGQMDRRASLATDGAAIDRLLNQEEEAGLSCRGRDEAAKVAAFLGAQPKLTALYSSPLLRAVETGDISARLLEMPLRVTPAITELRTGRLRAGSVSARVLDGLARAPLAPPIRRLVLGGALVPTYFHAWKSGGTEGGETREEFAARTRTFFADLEREHPEDARIALFAHGYLVFTLTHATARSPRDRIALWRQPYIANGGITTMELHRGSLRLVRYGSASHLR